MELSNIQLKILTKLLKSRKLRYSKTRPKGIENDLFNYHLKFLVSKGFVRKSEGLYSLADKGKIYVQKMDSAGAVKEYFKVSVVCHVIRDINNKVEILLHERQRQPYFGEIYGGIAGKVLIGEKIEDSAERKFKEETGLDCKFKFIGVIRKIRRSKEDTVVEDTIYHYCYGENPTGTLKRQNKFGRNYWGSFQDAIAAQRKNITAGKYSEEVLDRINNKDFSTFYYTEDIILARY